MNIFDAVKTRMIGLPYGEKLQQYVKPFSSNTGPSRTDRQTDGQTYSLTDKIAMSISRISVLTRDKNCFENHKKYRKNIITVATETEIGFRRRLLLGKVMK